MVLIVSEVNRVLYDDEIIEAIESVSHHHIRDDDDEVEPDELDILLIVEIIDDNDDNDVVYQYLEVDNDMRRDEVDDEDVHLLDDIDDDEIEVDDIITPQLQIQQHIEADDDECDYQIDTLVDDVNEYLY